MHIGTGLQSNAFSLPDLCDVSELDNHPAGWVRHHGHRVPSLLAGGVMIDRARFASLQDLPAGLFDRAGRAWYFPQAHTPKHRRLRGE
jgi:hypothetical protein